MDLAGERDEEILIMSQILKPLPLDQPTGTMVRATAGHRFVVAVAIFTKNTCKMKHFPLYRRHCHAYRG